MLIEAIVSAFLIGVLLFVSLRVLSAAAMQRRAIDKRAVALEEAAGAMQRARALAWDELTVERLNAIKLSPQIDPMLSGASLRWSVEDSTSTPASKHVRVEITWQSPAGPAAPTRLSYWAYAPVPESTEEAP